MAVHFCGKQTNRKRTSSRFVYSATDWLQLWNNGVCPPKQAFLNPSPASWVDHSVVCVGSWIRSALILFEWLSESQGPLITGPSLHQQLHQRKWCLSLGDKDYMNKEGHHIFFLIQSKVQYLFKNINDIQNTRHSGPYLSNECTNRHRCRCRKHLTPVCVWFMKHACQASSSGQMSGCCWMWSLKTVII